MLSDDLKRRDYDSNLGSESSTSSSSSSYGGQSRRPTASQQQPFNSNRPPAYEEYAGFPGGARQYWKWKAQMDAQEVEEEYRRARDAQAREYARQRNNEYGYNEYDFSHAIFRQRMWLGIGRILPMFIPILIIMSILRSSVRKNRDAASQIIYDEQGRAYVRDQDGVPHRMREFDLR